MIGSGDPNRNRDSGAGGPEGVLLKGDEALQEDCYNHPLFKLQKHPPTVSLLLPFKGPRPTSYRSYISSSEPRQSCWQPAKIQPSLGRSRSGSCRCPDGTSWAADTHARPLLGPVGFIGCRREWHSGLGYRNGVSPVAYFYVDV